MPANYVLIQETTLNASAASVTFSSIPSSGYTDLKVVYSARGDAATTDRGMFVRLNGDTGSNYTYKFVRGDGSSAGSGGTTTTFLYFGNFNAATSTSNTFGNGEFYIPNYLGSTQKSVSSDSVSENNATSAWTTLAAGLWTGTSAVSTILLYPESGNFVAGSSFSLYGIAAVGTTPTVVPKASGGDIVVNDGTYWYHAFLASGTFIPNTNLSCDVLQVAGGGGTYYGPGGGGVGGGGAGGLLGFTNQAVATGSYTVTVGAGGSNANGSNSQFGSLTAAVGGGRGGSADTIGSAGGSGGGTGFRTPSSGTAAGTSGQGNAGGNTSGSYPNFNSGGGGGAGAAGGTGGTNGGAGGAGVNTYSSWATATGTGASGYYAGGGGGMIWYSSGSPGAGGAGGGGTGAATSTSQGTAGTANTGGGAGGSAEGTINGGSGIVIVRYLMAV